MNDRIIFSNPINYKKIYSNKIFGNPTSLKFELIYQISFSNLILINQE
jgi:hypothetical protein